MLCWLSGMDANFVEYYKNGINEENSPSQSSKSLRDMSFIVAGDTEDRQESGTCQHFSIRGYVSEVRKINRDKCWPFGKIDDHNQLDDLAKLLPPIVVSQFRWWACKSCLRNANKIESAGENGSVTNFHDLESRRLKTDVESFKGNDVADPHAHASTSLSGFRVVSGDTTLGEGSIEAASFINSKDGHFQPLLVCEDKDKDSILTNSSKKDIHQFEGELCQVGGNQNPLSDTFCGATDERSLGKDETNETETRKTRAFCEGHKITRARSAVLQRENNVHRDDNLLGTITTMVQGTKFGYEPSEAELNTRIISSLSGEYAHRSRNDQGSSSRDVVAKEEPLRVNSSVERIKMLDIEGLEAGNYNDLKRNGDPVANEDDYQSYSGRLSNCSFPRKPRKLRTLNDIMKSEAPGQSRQTHLPYNDECNQTKEGSNNLEDGPLKGEKSVTQYKNTKVKGKKYFPTKKRRYLSEGEDEGPSLIQLLKMSKKPKAQNFDRENKHAKNGVVISQSVANGSSEKCLYSRTKKLDDLKEISTKIFEDKIAMDKIQGDVDRTPVKLQQVQIFDCHVVPEYESAKNIDGGESLPSLAINSDTLYIGQKRHDIPRQHLVVSKKQIVKCDVDYGAHFPMDGPKDSSQTSQNETPDSCMGAQQISEKGSMERKTGAAEQFEDGSLVQCDLNAAGSTLNREKQVETTNREKKTDAPVYKKQDVVDDIPIEILELLQSNYHKNHQLNSGYSSTDVARSSGINKKMADLSLSRPSNVSDSYGNTVSYSRHENRSGVFSKFGNGLDRSVSIVQNTESSNLGRRAQTSRRRKRQIKVKDGPSISRKPTDYRFCSDPIQCPQDTRLQVGLLQNLEQHHNSKEFSRQYACRCFSQGYSNSDLIPQTTPLERNPSKATQNSDDLKLVGMNRRPFHRAKQKTDVKHKMTFSAGSAYLEKVKECDSKLMHPSEGYPNETISAMHLLRLVDPAVSSTASVHLSVNNSQAGLLSKLKRSDNYCQGEFIDVDAGMRDENAFICLSIPKHQIDDQTSSLSLMSATPLSGTLNSSSQRSMPSDSDQFPALCGSTGLGSRSALLYSKAGRKKKIKKPNSAILMNLGHTSLGGQVPFTASRHSRERFQPTLNSPPCYLNSAGFPKHNEARESLIQVEYKNKEEVNVALRGIQTELCPVNRNPADFSTIDENNLYMIGYEDLKPRDMPPKRKKEFRVFPDSPRRQKFSKPVTLKGS